MLIQINNQLFIKKLITNIKSKKILEKIKVLLYFKNLNKNRKNMLAI